MNVFTLIAIIPVVLAVALIIAVVRRNITENPGGKVDITPVIPAVVVLMVALLVIGNVSETADDSRYGLYDCVPLSSFGADATIEGASAEVVEIGGESYVRMVDLGKFTATSGGKTNEYEVTKAKLDLVLISGQSNSVGFTSPSYYTDPSPVAPGKAFYLGTEQGAGQLAGLATPDTLSTSDIVDMVDDSGDVRVAQMYPAFCSDYVQETGHRVLVINTGIVGQRISAWEDGGQCDVWMQDVFDRVEEIESAGKVVLTPTVALWSQGHADASSPVNAYKAQLIPLLDKLWDGHYGYAFANVLTSLPRHTGYDDPINPAIAQMEVAAAYSGFTVATSIATHFTADQMRTGDTAHYSQESYGWIGEAFAIGAAKAMRYAPVAESLVMPIDPGAVAALPSTVSVYGTTGNTYTVSARWTATSDPSVYSGALSNAPRGTVLDDGAVAEAYPVRPGLFTYDSTGHTITGLSSAAAGATHLVIPTTANGNEIMTIGANAFQNNTDIVRVEALPDSTLYTIQSHAFDGCTSLESIDIPATATTMQNYVFTSCRSLESIDLPEGTTSVGLQSFNGCTSLKEVYIPGSVTNVYTRAFFQCTGTTSVTFGEGFAATLASECFANWTFYASDGVTEIDKTVSSNLAGHTFKGTASALVMQS